MDNDYNRIQAKDAKKRRAMFYKLHLRGNSCSELAEKFRVTYECMRRHLKRAKEDNAK